jgi:3-oxoacyl-[acyl-carrier protein] reductase
MITIITGGGSGIGRSAAELFAQAGAHVIVTDINKKSAKYVSKLIRSKQGKSEGHLLDVTSLKNVNIVINKRTKDVEFKRCENYC